MSKVANIIKKNTSTAYRFVEIAKGGEEYGNQLMEEYKDTNSSSSDHFISTMKDIDRISKVYSDELARGAEGNPSARLEEIAREIQKTSNLSRWLISLMCAFMYGFDGENDFDVQPIQFEVPDPANPGGDFLPVEQVSAGNGDYRPAKKEEIDAGGTVVLSYFDIFKRKFCETQGHTKTNHNDYSSLDDDVNSHSLNVLAFNGRKGP